MANETNKRKRPQQSKVPRKRQAVAPYNFVPLPEKAIYIDPTHITAQDQYSALTGYIACELHTLTPLYTRTAVTPDFYQRWGERLDKMKANDADREQYAQFFHVKDTELPVIPGSTLRGMIRSLIEIISYGKIQWVTETDKLSFRAVAAPGNDPLKTKYEDALGKAGRKVRAGYVRKSNGRWYIQPALTPKQLGIGDQDKPYLQVKKASLEDGDIPDLRYFDDENYRPQYHPVSFKTEVRRGTRGTYTFCTVGNPAKQYVHSGVLVCSGNMDETGGGSTKRKKYAIVLPPDKHEKPLLMDEQAIQDYRDSLTDFQKEAPFDPAWGCLIEERPIFYVPGEQGRVIYFGHTPNFRIPMRSGQLSRAVTPMDLTPPELREAAGIDLADSIFGYAHSAKQRSSLQQACAGRVFFSDATFVAAKHDLWLSEALVTPKILASPKPTTFQHYVVQDANKNHNSTYRENLAHYGTPSPTETVIRGHKLYWHKRGTQLQEIAETAETQVENWAQDTQHTQIRPVNRGVQFSFRVYFENLLPVELGALLWSLALPTQDEEKRYRHKVGMGKPLGMGSVRITPTLVLSDRRDGKARDGDVRKGRYSQLFDGDQWYTPERTIKKVDRYVQEFESFVLENMHESERNNAVRLADVERVAMLLKMLEWLPGLDPAKTRYMTIEPDEFSERPVLPTPLNIE